MRVALAVACVLFLAGCNTRPTREPTLADVIEGLPQPIEVTVPAPPAHLTVEMVNRAELQGRLAGLGVDFRPRGRRMVLDAAYVTTNATLYICFEYGAGPYEQIECGDGVLFVHEEWSL